MQAANHAYPDVLLFIDGAWRKGSEGTSEPVLNPATAKEIGRVPHASRADLDAALAAADKAFKTFRHSSPFDRYQMLRKAASLLRERADSIAAIMSLEQGKPIAEAKGEIGVAADVTDWAAEEGRRTYGRVVPARADGVYQLVVKEPVGPVAAFTPWNFPINQAVRKMAAALATGCTIIVKGPEETPASCAELVRAYADAGLPAGTVQLVFGVPSEISEYLIPHPIIKKISFTGSTAVGKMLAALAGKHMKKATMELGGHAPALVFDDCDLDKAVSVLVANKFRNAGQVCVSPTRFMVQEAVYEPFVEKFVAAARALKVGPGNDPVTKMGPLANSRRIDAMEALINDAVAKGGTIRTGGKRIGNEGYYFEPTVMTGLSKEARIMNEEPFGPLVPIASFKTRDEALEEANRLPFGLAAYAWTRSAATIAAVSAGVESGMISINHHGLALPEVPFGGIKDSGSGSEGGIEALEAYMNTKFVTTATL